MLTLAIDTSRLLPASKIWYSGPGNTFFKSPSHVGKARLDGRDPPMRYQAQTFIKQVQVDLLALSDADLFQTIDQWGPGKESSGLSHGAPEVIWSAIGYTRAPAETEHFSCPPSTKPGVEPEVREHWLAPSPHQLCRLLTRWSPEQRRRRLQVDGE